jgi:hypothetical protein
MISVPGSQNCSSSRKPPPATRHRAVMSLSAYVPLFDMRLHTSRNLQEILESASKAEKLMLVMAVCTDRVYRVKEDPNYLELSIAFYPSDDNQPPKSDVRVIMPCSWTPKMYLSALNKSIRKHTIILLESIEIGGRFYCTINELQWLFTATEEATHSLLICSASYIRVSGGVLKNI